MTLTIYQKFIIVLVLMVFVVLMYDELFHLLAELLRVSFESVEYILDLVVEHFFATGTHETQVIVFYILAPLVFCGLYLLYCFCCYWYYKLKHNLHQQKTETLAQWQALSVLKKIAWWCFLIVVIGGGLVFNLM